MNKIVLEGIKFIYCVVLAVVALLIMAFVFDCLCALVSGGWTDYTGHARAGSWPILTGTVSRSMATPFVYILFLLLGIGGIVRMIMGNSIPFFLRRWETVSTGSTENENGV